MKVSLSLFILFSILSCSTTETIPQPKDIDVQTAIQDNLKEAEKAQVAYQTLQKKREKNNTYCD